MVADAVATFPVGVFGVLGEDVVADRRLNDRLVETVADEDVVEQLLAVLHVIDEVVKLDRPLILERHELLADQQRLEHLLELERTAQKHRHAGK